MKRAFYLIGLLLGLLFFVSEEGHQEQGNQKVTTVESYMQETATSDMERKLEVLSEELQHKASPFAT